MIFYANSHARTRILKRNNNIFVVKNSNFGTFFVGHISRSRYSCLWHIKSITTTKIHQFISTTKYSPENIRPVKHTQLHTYSFTVSKAMIFIATQLNMIFIKNSIWMVPNWCPTMGSFDWFGFWKLRKKKKRKSRKIWMKRKMENIENIKGGYNEMENL